MKGLIGQGNAARLLVWAAGVECFQYSRFFRENKRDQYTHTHLQKLLSLPRVHLHCLTTGYRPRGNRQMTAPQGTHPDDAVPQPRGGARQHLINPGTALTTSRGVVGWVVGSSASQ